MAYRVTANEDVKRHWNFPSKKRDQKFDRWFDQANANNDRAPSNGALSYKELVDMDRNALGMDSMLALQHNEKPRAVVGDDEKTGLARYRTLDVDPQEVALVEFMRSQEALEQLSFSFDD